MFPSSNPKFSFAPPVDSAPEANKFPRQFYQNEWDNPPPTRPAVTAPVVQAPPPAQKRRTESRQPTRAPPKEAPLKQIFPWENKPRTTTRVFDDDVQNQEDEDESEESDEEGTTEGSQAEERDDEGGEEAEEDPITVEESKAWKTYIQENEWDAIPGIQDYVSDLKRRHTQGEGIPRIPGYFIPLISQERPSLPVTPNPVRRRTSQQTTEEHPLFPSAQGIPSQEDWVCFSSSKTPCTFRSFANWLVQKRTPMRSLTSSDVFLDPSSQLLRVRT